MRFATTTRLTNSSRFSSVDALIDQFDSIPTCEELCQTLNNWTDSYKAEQTICSSCGQAFVEGTLWCITCDADQIIVDDAWAENAEIVDDSDDMGQQLECSTMNFSARLWMVVILIRSNGSNCLKMECSRTPKEGAKKI